MNTRSVEILKKLCGGKNYQVEDLAHDFEISIRMIRYVIDDINVSISYHYIFFNIYCF